MGSTDETGKPYPVDIQLKTCLDEFEDDRSKFWKTKTEGADWGLQERLIGHAEHLARLLLRASEDLVAEPDAPDGVDQFSVELAETLGELDKAQELFKYLASVRPPLDPKIRPPTPGEYAESWFESAAPPDDSLLKLVWERLCIEAAVDLIDRIVPAANRMLFLYRIAAKSQPSAAVRRFLRRISRCFLWGFYPECLALCRGALDAAFMTAVPDNVCDEHGL